MCLHNFGWGRVVVVGVPKVHASRQPIASTFWIKPTFRINTTSAATAAAAPPLFHADCIATLRPKLNLQPLPLARLQFQGCPNAVSFVDEISPFAGTFAGPETERQQHSELHLAFSPPSRQEPMIEAAFFAFKKAKIGFALKANFHEL
jgi:hypothetical protein